MQRKQSLLSIKIINKIKWKGPVTRIKITSYGKVSSAKSFDSFSWLFCAPIPKKMAFNSLLLQKIVKHMRYPPTFTSPLKTALKAGWHCLTLPAVLLA